MVYPLTHKLLVIGSQGFIGGHFCRAYPEIVGIDRSHLDLCDPHLEMSTEGYRYALIAAGMGNPRKCAQNPDLSDACNVRGPLKLGKELLKRGILPIFFSSDYVLNDALEVAPLNLYGEQKLELEQEATKMDALVIRLSKVYGIEKEDGTLFDEMACRLSRGQNIVAAHDQVFAPVFVGDVVQRVFSLLQGGVRGLVTLAGPHFASRLEMAQRLADRLGLKRDLIQKISLDDLKEGIKRPKRLALQGDFPALTWEEGVERIVKNYAQ